MSVNKKVSETSILLWEFNDAPDCFKDVAREKVNNPDWVALVPKYVIERGVLPPILLKCGEVVSTRFMRGDVIFIGRFDNKGSKEPANLSEVLCPDGEPIESKRTPRVSIDQEPNYVFAGETG